MKLASALLLADVVTPVYTVPAATTAGFSFSIVNQGGENVKITASLTNGTQPTAADHIEFETELAPNEGLERTGLILGAGQKLYVKSNKTDVSVVVWGIEEVTT